MNKSTRALLLLVAVTLAVAPLRAVFPQPARVASGGGAHCMPMQDGGHAMHHATGRQSSSASAARHGCDRCCQGQCCDGACGLCAHAVLALPVNPAGASQGCSSFLIAEDAPRYIGRILYPPLRPPIALPA